MGIEVASEHRTSSTSDRLGGIRPHVIRLRPAPHSRTPIELYSLTITPADHCINWLGYSVRMEPGAQTPVAVVR